MSQKTDREIATLQNHLALANKKIQSLEYVINQINNNLNDSDSIRKEVNGLKAIIDNLTAWAGNFFTGNRSRSGNSLEEIYNRLSSSTQSNTQDIQNLQQENQTLKQYCREINQSITILEKHFRLDKTDKIRNHSSAPGEQIIPNANIINQLESFPKSQIKNVAKLINTSDSDSSMERLHLICSCLCKIIFIDVNEKIKTDNNLISYLQSKLKEEYKINIKIADEHHDSITNCINLGVGLLKEIESSNLQGKLYWIDINTSDEDEKKFDENKCQAVASCPQSGEIKFTVYPGYFTENVNGERKYELLATVWTKEE